MVTVLIAAIWIGVVLIWRVPNPLLTLAAAGATYGVFTIVLQQIMWNFVLGEVPAEAPDTAPILVISWSAILMTNTVYGTFLGLVATEVIARITLAVAGAIAAPVIDGRKRQPGGLRIQARRPIAGDLAFAKPKAYASCEN